MSDKLLFKVDPIYPKPKDYPANVGKAMKQAIKKALIGYVQETLQLSQQERVSNWNDKPYFKGKYKETEKDIILDVSVEGTTTAKKKWRWVSLGTKRTGTITAVRSPALIFRSRYYAKTRPGNIYGRKSRRYGPVRYIPKPVRIRKSSIKARKFEYYIIKENKRLINNIISKAIEDATRET